MLWGTLGPGIQVDVTLTYSTYLNLPSGPCQLDNVPCQTAKIIQEWFEEHGRVKAGDFATYSPNHDLIDTCGMCQKNKSDPWRPHFANNRTIRI